MHYKQYDKISGIRYSTTLFCVLYVDCCTLTAYHAYARKGNIKTL
jgi:hypothetical protein